MVLSAPACLLQGVPVEQRPHVLMVVLGALAPKSKQVARHSQAPQDRMGTEHMNMALTQRLLQGVPVEQRPYVWMVVSGASARKSKQVAGHIQHMLTREVSKGRGTYSKPELVSGRAGGAEALRVDGGLGRLGSQEQAGGGVLPGDDAPRGDRL